MGCVVVDDAMAGGVREALRRQARLLKVRELHFSEMPAPQRRSSLDVFGSLSVTKSVIFESQIGAGERSPDARDRILRTMVKFLQALRVEELVLDRGLDSSDSKVVMAARTGGPRLSYRHVDSRQEPLLWLPDGTAHTVGRGQDLDRLPSWHDAAVIKA